MYYNGCFFTKNPSQTLSGKNGLPLKEQKRADYRTQKRGLPLGKQKNNKKNPIPYSKKNNKKHTNKNKITQFKSKN